MARYRKQIYDYVMERRINGNPSIREVCFLSVGRPNSDAAERPPAHGHKTRFVSQNDWLSRVWREGVEFDMGAPLSYWMDAKKVLNFEALMRQKTFVCYDTKLKTTDVYKYCASDGNGYDTVVLYCGPPGIFYSPPVGSISIMYDGYVHFKYLRLKNPKDRETKNRRIDDMAKGLKKQYKERKASQKRKKNENKAKDEEGK